MQFDYSKLLGRIKEYGYTQERFAKEIGMSLSTLNAKLNNKSYFDQFAIRKSCVVLCIRDNEIGIYFFCQKSSEFTNDKQ